MALFALSGTPLLAFAARAAVALAPKAAQEGDMQPLVQGAQRGVQAYSRASDAYAADLVSVAIWAVLIAAAVVLLEWLAWRYRSRR
jgi:hypothetical protein